MMYVVKAGSDVRYWVFFNTYDAAVAACAFRPGLTPELNLTRPYCY